MNIGGKGARGKGLGARQEVFWIDWRESVKRCGDWGLGAWGITGRIFCMSPKKDEARFLKGKMLGWVFYKWYATMSSNNFFQVSRVWMAVMMAWGVAHAQNVQWIKTVMGPWQDHPGAMALDPQGNLLVSGNGEGMFNIDQKVLHTRGCTDPFLARFDANQEVVWAKSFGSMICDYALGMCADPMGNMYFLTMMNYDAYYDSLMVPYTEGEISIAKVDVNGNVVWVRHYGGEGYVYARSGLRYEDGKLFLSGVFWDSLVVGGQTLLHAQGTHDEGFVMQLDTMGNVNWVRHAFCFRDFEMNSLDVDDQGNCYVTGWFRGLTYFGSFMIHEPGGLMLAKLSPTGHVDWVKVMTGFLYSDHAQVKLGPFGDIYVASSTDSAVFLDSVEVVHGDGLFLLRLDPQGNFKWKVQGYSEHSLSASSLAVDSYGNAYLAGTFRSSFKMGGFEFPSANRWSYNTYLATIRSDGAVADVDRIKGPGTAFPGMLFLQGDTALYFAGHYGDTVLLGNHRLVSVGSWDGFYAKILVSPMVGAEDGIVSGEPVRFYPNPARGEIWMDGDGLGGKGGCVRIFDAGGRMVKEVAGYVQGDRIGIGELGAGVYCVCLDGVNGGRRCGRLVVMGE
jgi:hypothetical protein